MTNDELLALLDGGDAPSYPEGFTSRRSFLDRQAQLDRIVNEDMPRNRAEIQHAKEFGDLSENFEYENARRRERQLIEQQSRMAAELKAMKVYDFADAAKEADGSVRLGSTVKLGYPDGTKKTYHILGAWDFDEALGVIACRGRLAEALCGCRAGDKAQIPHPAFDDDTLTVDVLEVKPLPKKIVDWANA